MRTKAVAQVATEPAYAVDRNLIYGMGVPFQLDGTRCGVFLAPRVNGQGHVDYEAGSDLVTFDRLDGSLGLSGIVPLSRNHEEQVSHQGQRISVTMVKYPITGGFVPWGAVRADATAHPHAGTGFGIVHAMAFENVVKKAASDVQDSHEQRLLERSRREAKFRGEWPIHQFLELQQYSYDGHRFSVDSVQTVGFDGLLLGHTFDGRGSLIAAIADGDDLLLGLRIAETPDSGVSRWRRENNRWSCISWTNVTRTGGVRPPSSYHNICVEPSVNRGRDGELLFTTRQVGRSPLAHTLRLWRSTDGGSEWNETITVPAAREQAPVTLNQAADGSPYLVCNAYHPTSTTFPDGTRRPTAGPSGEGASGERPAYSRERLVIWPIEPGCAALGTPQKVFDGWEDLPHRDPPVSWWADHPCGSTVRLADRSWHHVLGFRVASMQEARGVEPALPESGFYLAEIDGDGTPQPPWRFAD